MRKIRKRKGLWLNCWSLILQFSLILLFFINFPNVLGATDYPTKPIQIVVGSPPGGGSDIIARFVSEKVSELLGQPVVVVSKIGAGGILGTYAVLAAPPDGYTILVVHPPLIGAPIVTKGVTFNFIRDFTPINLAVISQRILVVKKDAPWQTFEELIADAKKNPGKLTYSTTGYGSTPHFAGELLKKTTGTDITQVPMDGSASSLTAIMGGHIDITFLELGTAYKYLQAGSLRALIVMDKKRLKDFPKVPTTVEKGFPDLIMAGFQGFAVRSGTPKVIVEKLENVFEESLKDKEIVEKLEKTGWVVENLSSGEATKFLANDYQTKLELAKLIGMLPK